MVSARLEDLADSEIADYVTQTDGNGKNSRHIALQDCLAPTKKARKLNLNKSCDVPDAFLDKGKSNSLVNSIHAICCFGGVVAPNSIVDDKSDKEEICIDDCERESWLLPPQLPQDAGKKCLVLDLDETLVHSTFKAVPWADFAIPVKVGTNFSKFSPIFISSFNLTMKRCPFLTFSSEPNNRLVGKRTSFTSPSDLEWTSFSAIWQRTTKSLFTQQAEKNMRTLC